MTNNSMHDALSDAAPEAASAPPVVEHARARAARRLRGFLLVASIVIAADQVTKALVRARLPFGETWPEGWTLIRLARVENTGAAFGMLQGAGDVLIIVALFAVAAITFFLLTLPGNSRLYPVALSLVLGGAIGNLIDRVRTGSVTDFIDPTHYPAFNVADSAIVIGVGALFVLSWRDGDAKPARDDAARATPARQPE